MSEPSPHRHAATPPHRHVAPNPLATIRTPRFWLAPIVVSVTVFSALALLYLAGILNPTTNLRHFPVAVVNADAGPDGKQIVDGLVSGLNRDEFDVRVLSTDEANTQLDRAQIYGLVQIPSDFSAKLQALGRDALRPGQVTRPVITISTNPRAGELGSSIAGLTLAKAVSEANTKIGQQLSGQVAKASGAPLPGGVSLTLSSPVDIQANDHNPLPNGTGNGLSAFYYALLLLLAGFTGSIVVSSLVDSMLGFVPSELGPIYRFAEQVQISRFRTLLVKWGLMAAMALLTSAAYVGIANALGMPIPNGWTLWAYGAFTIAAVGITSTSLIAVLGSVGLLVNLFIFVMLGLPSNGATIPLEAAPRFFGWLAKFEPMHQVFLGARALLYFDGRADAGLTRALVMTAIGLVIGVVIGGVVTRIYDRRGHQRAHAADDPQRARVYAKDD
ncbi:YhgE/Pip domain-containing protein [Mycobacterium sp.]|uniref:YhgE/Pip domain-containing protein n=1 Tax=Mycobacterium sp. TaxID=1785 RepID=UPI002D8F9AE4|nr:YhgE/Pip domain-containing protein [Mycobacterium sp.]